MGIARKIILGTSASVIAIGVLGIPAAHADVKPKKLVVFQDPPSIRHNEEIIQVGQLGSVLYFESKLRNKSGDEVGMLSGHITVTDVTPYSAYNKTRYRELVFQLPEGQIVALGAADYDQKMLTRFDDDNAPVTIAVVGGTGKYRSARGEVVTSRPGFGNYRHVITLDN